jgi:FkbM family methyltransferase
MRINRRVEIRIPEFIYTYHSPEWDDLNEVCLDNLKNWEPNSRSVFRKLSKNSKVIIDVGAYTGIYSIESALSNPACSVISVEPNPTAKSALEINLSTNNVSNVQVLGCALSSEKGNKYLYLTENLHGSSTTSLIPSEFLELKVPVEVEIPDLIFGHLEVTLIKIDVEGFEKNILQGFREIILRDRPVILMEALRSQDLLGQATIMTSFKYHPPIRAGMSSGDERNYFWVPLESSTALELVNRSVSNSANKLARYQKIKFAIADFRKNHSLKKMET